MKLTKEMIEKYNPCPEGLDWYTEHGTDDLLSTLLKLNKVNSDWAIWLFTHLMNKDQCIEIAIYSVKLVLKESSKVDKEKARLASYAIYDAKVVYAIRIAYLAAVDRLDIQEDIIRKAVKILENA